jgi:DNA-directed RNA polymerase specialized sigma24 family protein
LREYHGFNSEEISEIVGVPAATVRSRIFYGLRTVRKKLKDRGVS